MRLRVHKKSQAKYYYALSPSDAVRVRMIGLLGLCAVLLMGVGFWLFMSQSALVALLCAPFFVVTILYNLINFWLMSRYPGFSTKEHRKRVVEFARADNKPRVAVFVPAAGEPEEVVSKTIRAATKIRYANFEVFLLDDSKDGAYKKLAKKVGVNYLRRRNVGVHKKAGNMNAAISRIRGYSHILVLDADFIARPEILQELMPYAKPDVGIVQSPQHFELTDTVYKRSKIEFGAGMIQRDFYRITQVARNRFGGAICVGTNAVYNVGALKKIGGFRGVGKPEWGHSEDVHTGLKMINSTNRAGNPYRIEYVPIQLATGICPSDHLSFYKQQNRWATGSMQLTFSKLTIFSNRLKLSQKIAYFSNSLYYFYTIGILFAPVQLLVLLLSPSDYNWNYTALFIPTVLITYIVTPFLLRQALEPVASSVVVISNAHTFAQAFRLMLAGRPLGWEATGSRNAIKRHRQFTSMKIFSSVTFIIVYVSTLLALLLNYKFGFNASILICILFLSAFVGHIIYLHHTLVASTTLKRFYLSKQFYGYGLIISLVVTSSITAFTYSKQYDMKFDATRGLAIVNEIAIKSPAAVPAPEEIKNELIKLPSTDTIITVQPNENHSKIATDIVMSISKEHSLSQAAKGKLQDALMHELGYNNVVFANTTYTLTQSRIDELTNASRYVEEVEHAFWANYATKVGLSQ